MSLEPDSTCRYIVSVDIGIVHFALVLIECTAEYEYRDTVWFELMDITRFPHLDAHAKQECALAHTKTIADWLGHVMFLHSELFQFADRILIERQPPQGHTAVEQLLFFQFRSKAVLVSPRSVHKFFGWSSEIDYDRRKEKSVAAFRYRLKQSTRPWLLDMLDALERQHDVADAFVQTLFFLYKQHEEWRRTREASSFSQLDQYRYTETIS